MTDSHWPGCSVLRLLQPDRRPVADLRRRHVDRSLHVPAQGPASPWAGTELAPTRFSVSGGSRATRRLFRG